MPSFPHSCRHLEQPVLLSHLFEFVASPSCEQQFQRVGGLVNSVDQVGVRLVADIGFERFHLVVHRTGDSC